MSWPAISTLHMSGFAIVYQIKVERQVQYIASFQVSLKVALKAAMKQDDNPAPWKKRRPNQYNWQRARTVKPTPMLGPTNQNGNYAMPAGIRVPAHSSASSLSQRLYKDQH
jgi:hypothetical protein